MYRVRNSSKYQNAINYSNMMFKSYCFPKVKLTHSHSAWEDALAEFVFTDNGNSGGLTISR